MNCNLLLYIEEQETVCLRIAKTAHEGSPERQEWLKTAQALMDRAEDHKKICKKCKQPSKQTQVSS